MKRFSVTTRQMAKAINLATEIPVDITVKSGVKEFAPTWEIVMGYKQGRISSAEYSEKYRIMMQRSYKENKELWEQYIHKSISQQKILVLRCYCAGPTSIKSGVFCHRHLLKRYIAAVAEKLGLQTQVIEESI